MRHSNEDIRKARETNLTDYLQRHGYALEPHDSHGHLHLAEHKSLVVYPQTNSWYWYSHGQGGDVLEFLQKYEGKSFQDSVAALLGGSGRPAAGPPAPHPAKSETVPMDARGEPFVLPETSGSLVRTYAYLIQGRRIAPEIVKLFAASQRIMEDTKHNCLFVGYDGKTGKPSYAAARGTMTGSRFKRDLPGSRKEHGFRFIGASDRLYAFESPIDLLSFLTLHKDKVWQRHSYVSLGGLSGAACDNVLANHPNIRHVVLCLDNDEAGRDAAARLSENLAGRGYKVTGLLPEGGAKDWNDQLKETTSFSEPPVSPARKQEAL